MDEALTPVVSRRDFLGAAGAAFALAGGDAPAAEKAVLPTKRLGRTRVRVPILGLGTAPAGYRPEKEAVYEGPARWQDRGPRADVGTDEAGHGRTGEVRALQIRQPGAERRQGDAGVGQVSAA